MSTRRLFKGGGADFCLFFSICDTRPCSSNVVSGEIYVSTVDLFILTLVKQFWFWNFVLSRISIKKMNSSYQRSRML